ncbi:GNAT family N-acetyltransferase [Pengzhenrongella phosphoraccumulans]|uniref:GNAT family N-acetyltransferase n=1 Tax=Pengzhenrongella phosphoraccumulans TaxID=3114394 RepID=UPI00388F0062
MTAAVRNYTASAGFTDDFHRVRDFLVRINQGGAPTPGFLWGRWEWMFSQTWYCDTSALARIGVWEDDGEIVAVVTYENTTGFAWFLTDQDHAFLHEDMLRYALQNLTRNGAIRVLIEDTDQDLPPIAAAHGLTRTKDRQPNAALDLTGYLSYRLPDGYRIASLADDCDLHRLNRVLHRGFNNPGEPQETPDAIHMRRTGVSGPHLIRDLNIVVIAPNGEYVAYCGIWYDPVTDYAYVEPVCTDPDHRKRGLGRAAVLEAARRCGHLGAKVAYVSSDQQFYYSIGFVPHSSGTWWESPHL